MRTPRQLRHLHTVPCTTTSWKIKTRDPNIITISQFIRQFQFEFELQIPTITKFTKSSAALCTMSGTSKVGQGSVYEAGDQRNISQDEERSAERFHQGKENSHLPNDSSKFYHRRLYHSSRLSQLVADFLQRTRDRSQIDLRMKNRCDLG